MTAAVAEQAHPTLEFRPARPADLAFVFDSWLKSQWALDARYKMAADVFFPMQRSRIERLLKRSALLVAYSPVEPDEVLAWGVFESVGELLVLHFLYTKKDFRRLGLARAVLDQALATTGARSVQYTHKTDARWKRFMLSLGATFNPFLGA